MAVPDLVHRGVAYDDPAVLGAALVPLCAGALGEGRPVTLALAPATAAVVRDGLDADAVARLEFLDPTRPARSDAFQLAARRATSAAASVRAGRRPLVVTQHQPGLGLPDAYWSRLEAALDRALRLLPVTLLCAYRRATARNDAARDGTARDGAAGDGDGLPTAFLATHGELVTADALEHPVPNTAHRDPADVVRGLPGAVVAPAPPDARRWEFRADDLGRVRHELGAVVATTGLGDEAAEDLVYAASEVATNAVEHGGGRGTLATWVADGEAICLVSDTGRLSEPFPGVVPPPVDQDRGRGLWLARALCDDVEVAVDDEGTRVRLARRLVGSEPVARRIS